MRNAGEIPTFFLNPVELLANKNWSIGKSISKFLKIYQFHCREKAIIRHLDPVGYGREVPLQKQLKRDERRKTPNL